MRRFVCILISVLGLGFALMAQDYCEYSRYSGEAAERAALYRGKQWLHYRFLYNGTFFWESPEFQRGDVWYNGKVYRDVLVNVDAVSGDLLVQKSDSHTASSPDGAQVVCFTMGDKCFINLRRAGYDVPKGFYQMLTDGRDIYYRQVTKTKYTAVGDHNGKPIGYEDPNYRPEVLTYFLKEEKYYGMRRGGMRKVHLTSSRRRALDANVFPREKLIGAVDLQGYAAADYGTVPEPAQVSSGAMFTGLPVGYFSEGEQVRNADYLKYLSDNRTIASYQNKVYMVGSGNESLSGRVKVRGRVRNISTGEALPGVSLFDEKTGTYALTGDGGEYEISVPLGENVLNFSEFTMEEMRVHILVQGPGDLDVVMKEKVTELNGALITADSRVNHKSAGMGLEKVSIKTISKIPAAFGEGDIIKAVTTLPGVKTVGEASGGFNVRGGSADQNLILFNEGTIYNPSHMFGIFSAFNPDVVDGVELYKSSIPAEYGGRISSVLDIGSRDGSLEKFKGSLGIGLLTSRAEIEGPVAKGRTSFILGGRTTYSDWILKNLPANSGYADGSAGFNDVNLGITHKFSDDKVLRAYGYWSRDRFAFTGDTTFRYSNINAALQYRSRLNDITSMTVAAGYDGYSNSLDNTFGEFESYTLETAVNQAYLRAGFKSKLGAHTFSYGIQAVEYMLSPGTRKPFGETSEVLAVALPGKTGFAPDIYAGDSWKISDEVMLDGGLRWSSFISGSDHKYYGTPELRLSGRYSFSPDLSVKAGFNSMAQYIHLVSNTSSISPMDTWTVCDGDIKPQNGFQAATGLYWTIFDGTVDLSLEGYWKRVWNYLDYKSGASLVMNPDLSEDLVPTTGKSYGVELMLRKSVGNLSGWVSYTWSRAFLKEMQDRGLSTINHGDWYNAPFDKPHDLKVVANYRFTHRYSISANLDWSTGRPVTIPIGKYMYGGGYRLAYSERNGYRIPDYFRLDLALNIEPGHYLKQLAHMSVTLGCYNVTGRRNAYSVYFSSNGSSVQGYMLSVFATQIPYINLNLKF